MIKIFPDTGVYEGYADTVLKSSAWWHHADLNTFIDITLFRMPLYPLIIACGKFLCGEKNWVFFVALIQILTFIASAFSISHLMKRLNFKGKEKIFVLIGYITGLPLFFSLSILTDSLFTSLGVICLCSLSIYLLEESNRKNLVIFLVSLFLMSFLKESTAYYAITLLPFSFYFLFKYNLKKTLKCALIILAPVLAGQTLIKSWNYYRTGEYILTTGLATALVAPQLDFIEKYPEYRDTFTLTKYLPEKQEPSFTDGVQAVADWIKKEKLTTPQVIETLKRDYYKSLLLYPKESLYICLKRIPLDIAFIEMNPFNAIQEFFDPLRTKIPRISFIMSHPEKLELYPILGIFNMILLNIFRVISVFVFLLGFFKTFQRFYCFCPNPINYIYLSLFAQSIMWIFLHGFFHLEMRYILTSIFIFTLLGISPTINQQNRRSVS